MGYTIYYRNESSNAKEILQNKETFQKFKKDFLEVMQLFNITETNIQTEADEYFSNASETCFYEIGETDLALIGPHESFIFPSYVERKADYGGDPSFNFTKTNGKSYDGLVKILYLLGVKHYGGILEHDGYPEDYLGENKDSYTENDQKAMLHCLDKFELMNYLPLEDEELEFSI